ncbi:High-affinity branched-chain amino acid transport system permease protein LivH [Pseudovibrio axinellae]|uniref:High-affinity branched-chain amino acid transport system permease protein LivH n=1 Tax=Pseudovibrio axinellae TaxID=989403 RepID=A0A166BCT0_9HYPH|nr:urea ABC transporter permease subunit UrtB [Pseudovibrio axinellae]KZL22132.1 High-affinity branched-chain amino acid transport system permease protein LivH [Pseudovibrio axinellae]SEQ54000.1 amino acid/amide ABC transporter membrane protein 1, HAAT family [Pseudovibrio axinellae]
MKRFIRHVALLLAFALCAVPAAQADEELTHLISALANGKLKEMPAKISALEKAGNSKIVPLFEALSAGTLFYRKADKAVFITRSSADGITLMAPLTLQEQGVTTKKSLKKIKVNNKLRRQLKTAIANLTLLSPDVSLRLSAAKELFKSSDPAVLPLLEEALHQESDASVRQAMQESYAAMTLRTQHASQQHRLDAIETLKAMGNQQALSVLTGFVASASEPEERDAATSVIASINKRLARWSVAQNVWYGLSLGSVLLLAAIGLAITFGVMGVINMAHGEMVMIGAYTTFMVQEVIRNSFPGLFDYSLAFALPLAFLASGAVGFAMERGIIRFLYGRPLETLLATWGVSLMLQQAVRTVFGPTNKEVGNPDWMSGAFELGAMTLTANRIWILAFAFVVFAVLLVVLRRTQFGLEVRAVTQNRRMAASMGIRTPWIDALTFALGSGIAGMAGVALSQISNVSPNLGQLYIIDSFMVVVFGGVGNLWGTFVGAMTLGVANKFLEPYAGAVLAKILTLVFIILFIQKKPRGLFALKGRAVDL